MGCLGNVIWFLCGGLISGLSWCLAGILWCITIVGAPIGVLCFRYAKLCFFPFGKDVEYSDSTFSLIVNIIWIVVSGVPLAIEHLIWGLIFCITIVGIPFGLQHFKLAKFALMPFGTQVN